jgi:hypothetical protein
LGLIFKKLKKINTFGKIKYNENQGVVNMVDLSKYDTYELIKKYRVYFKEGEKPAKITIEKYLKTGEYYAILKLPDGKKFSSHPTKTPEDALNDPVISFNVK